MDACLNPCALGDNFSVFYGEDLGSGSEAMCVNRNTIQEITEPESGDMSHKIFVAIMTSLLAFVILIGNGLIIMSVAVVRKLRQPANYLIVSLALSDFLVALVVLPLTITYDILGEWIFGSTMCNIHVSFDVICCTTSIMNLCMISIDRYLMITKPMNYPKKTTAKLMAFMITTAWVISCLIILPALFGFTRNVTDDPTWIRLGPTSGLQNVSSESPQIWFPELSVHGPTYWTSCDSSRMAWQFSVDLETEYKVTEFRILDADLLLADFYIQTISSSQSDVQRVEMKDPFRENFLPTGVPTRYIRILMVTAAGLEVNGTPVVVEAYGEPIEGKTCLISQEVWFTIYSTVGAFYIPLAVMLCMYWKIYVEASRFKARHRARSKSISDQATLMVNNKKTEKLRKQGDTPQEMSLLGSGHPRLIFDDFISASNDEVSEKALGNSNNSSASAFKTETGANENGTYTGIFRQTSETSFGSAEKNSANGKTTLKVQCQARNGSLVTQSPVGATQTDWCKGLQYSTTSVKSPSFMADALNGVDCNQTNNRTDCNKNHRKLSSIATKSRIFQARSMSPLPGRASIISKRTYSIASNSYRTRSRGSIFGHYMTRRGSSSTSRDRLRNAKAIRTLGIIVITFTFCWLPFFILTFIRPFVCEHPESQDCFPLWLVRLVLWLGYLNSALNPIIYVGFSPDLRETFKFLICCKCANVDRRLAQIELRQAIEIERKNSDQDTGGKDVSTV